MTTVTRTDEFLDCVTRSGLIAAGVANSYQGALTPEDAARQLIAAGLLTRFQADVLLQGKHRGFLVGKYKILDLLGAGGMGRVYLCEHVGMGHRVAMKVLPADMEKSPSTVARFVREARAAARLNHPNIVRAHDLDKANGQHFIIMDYVDGVTLEVIGQRFAPLDVRRAANYIAQVAVGLAHIAAAGLTHRDIKPANLILDETGLVRILDLGLASFDDEASHGLTHESHKHSILGTADYIAPEQAIAATTADIRSDLYSLGGSLYFLLTGQVPFAGLSLAQKLTCHQVKPPAAIATLRPDVPPRLAAVAERLLAKRPEERYATPDEVVEALREWAEPAPAALRLRPLPLTADDATPTRSAAVTPRSLTPREPHSGRPPAAPTTGRVPLATPSSGRYRPPVADTLAEAVAAAQAGRRDEARQRLAEVTAHDPDNESAWLWLASVSDSLRTSAACLERVLHINPDNISARAGLARLDANSVECPACQHATAGPPGDCPGCGARLRLSPVADYMTRPAPCSELLRGALARLAQAQDAESIVQRGVVRLNLRRPAEALVEFEAALRLDPTRPGLQAYAHELAQYLARHPAAGRTVLVVGESVTARKLIGLTLGHAGYAVLEVASGQAALGEVERHGATDFCLIDDQMPGTDSTRLCKALKAHAGPATVRVVFVGSGGYFDRARARRAGASHYLTRPFRSEELLGALHQTVPHPTR